MDDARLILGDCLVRMAEIEPRSVDLIACDLPYEVTACRWDTLIPFEPLWDHFRRVLKADGSVALTASQPFTSMLVASNLAWFKYELIWDKVVGTNFANARFQPLKSHENILVFSPAPASFTPSGRRMTYHPQRSIRDPGKLRPYTRGHGHGVMNSPIVVASPSDQYDPESRLPVSVLRFPGGVGECNSRYRLHPTQKPMDLFEYLIRTYSNPGETVLDCAMGSGTTGVACLNTGRKFIGIESDTNHFATAERRIANARNCTPLFNRT